MNLTATIRDDSGMVLCAYTLKPVGEGTRRLAGHDVLELDGVRYLVNTVLDAEATDPDIIECGHCGAAVPFKGWGVWSTCPECGNKVKPSRPGDAGAWDGEPPDLDELPF